ncbi:sugar ABC transporter substrate-binding protein [Corallococcus praedator]|uniref:Sugar ABC transporter substrate-binding protein n=1 Tax=Corallococcus praedator TaxID=2316724 RepID=A0ABX9Q812_9BACT|nr:MULTISPECIES: polysaccharide export protein [Corallococcus]RKH02677.1 sugar ABC transporter substrate-binding protein [Corallococcus sp. CA047B]RKH20900.1 sugar ABC transporter substrate-binding protein [Corallococcus sp. CA031C]RKH92906.1 sugar ABC transporter substrate-binding protein [Corallococcus praedator]
MRQILLIGLALCANACAWGPGMHMDEDAFRERYAGKADAGASDAFEIVTIDASLLGRQLESRRQARPTPLVDPLAQVAVDYDYKVSAHDVLSVIVWDHPELTIPAGEFRSAEATGHPVAADGTMFYPHVGVIPVAGKTLRAIRELLTQKLASVIERPQLDVRVAGFRGQKVQVTGEVVAPGSLPITDVPLRVQDAISQARGFGPEADLRTVTLSRAGTTFNLDLQALYEQGDVSQNWLLTDGDIINVADRNRNKVFVLGEVRKPSSRLMVKGRMTLAEAIGDSEGFDPLTSNPGRIYVIRGNFNRPSIYKLDASSPDALLLAAQFQLQPHDVVFVSAHDLTQWNRIIQQIQPTVQLLWQAVDIGDRTIIIENP